MTNSFNMSNWRRRYVLVAESGNEIDSIPEYNEEKNGKITSFEEVKFNEPESKVIFVVGTEKNQEHGADITADMRDFIKWANSEELNLDSDEDMDTAAKKYFRETYSKHLSPEGEKSIRNQIFEDNTVEEEITEVEENPVDIISMDVPLFLRMLEYAREDASQDMDLHDVAEKAVKMSAQGEPLTMMHYDEIVAKEAPMVDTMSLYEKYFNAE